MDFLHIKKTILMNYSCLDFDVRSKSRLKPRGNTDDTSRVLRCQSLSLQSMLEPRCLDNRGSTVMCTHLGGPRKFEMPLCMDAYHIHKSRILK